MHQHHQHQHQLKSSKAGVSKRRIKMDYRRRSLLFISILAIVLLMTGYYFVTPCGDACVSKGVSDDSIFHLRESTSTVLLRSVPSYKTYCADDDASCPSYDNWPMTSTNFTGQRSSYIPTKPVFWTYDYTAFLSRHDVIKGPPKIITWMVKPRYWPKLQEPVRMRLCTEMPCRMTTNVEKYRQESAALVWNGQIMRDPAPPNRSHPDQVFVFHNDEPQKRDWTPSAGFRVPTWTSAFNWTMTYRHDSDLFSPYAVLVQSDGPVVKDYNEIWAKKSKFAVWLVSSCQSYSKREVFIKKLQQYVQIDVYGGCATFKCPRGEDSKCFEKFSTEYKFYLAFENGFCEDYISEKFFRYLELDTIIVARGSSHKKYATNGTYINTEDFSSIEELANHLKYLDTHPQEYIKILQAKDLYVPVYDDYPTRNGHGGIDYMEYHYEAVPFCEMCLRLWNLEGHRKYYPDINAWFDKANCLDGPADPKMLQ